MRAWSGEGVDAMGPTVPRTDSPKPNTPPPLKNGNDLVESGYLISVGSRTSRFRRKHKKKISLTLLLCIMLFLLCFAIVMTTLYVIQKHHKPVRICESKECLRSAANLVLSMDRTADPCENFYQYACGNWADDHPRPDSYLSFDWFRAKQVKVYTLVRDFLSRNTSNQPKAVQQAKDMYTACIDTATLNKRGLKPIFNVLQHLGLPAFPTYINATEDFDYSAYNFDWLEAVIKIKTYIGMDVLIGFDIFADPKNSSTFIMAMGTPETVNPFPSLKYKKTRHQKRPKHAEYTKHEIFQKEESFKITDDKPSEIDDEIDIDDDDDHHDRFNFIYAQIMKIFVSESGLVKNSKLSEAELDGNIIVAKNVYVGIKDDMFELESDNSTDTDDYQDLPRYTVSEIQEHTDLNVEQNGGNTTPIWKRYLEGIFNISEVTLDFDIEKIVVSDEDLKYLAQMAAYVSKTPPVVLELFIWMKVVEVMAVHSTSELRGLFERAYQAESPNYYPGSRSLQCANAVNDMMGMAVSYGIADPHFFEVTKPKVEIMLNELKNSLAHLVGQAKWMDDNTKLATYKKIIEMKSFIGFPDWLLEEGKIDEYYEGIDVQTDTHIENMINIIQSGLKKAFNSYHSQNNMSWATDPTEVNAYHTFQQNTITIPLVVLQYPFYDLGLDSLNYGTLGTVLGHEITHGFDDFGRYFDKNGNALPWWSNETVASFENKTQCFVDQYSEYYLPEVDKHVDGKKTLGENIADNGGVREAFAALKEHLRKRGPEPKLPGFEQYTSEQMFFLSYGNLWCEVSTKESLKHDLEDEHSPQQFRVMGSLQNVPDFARVWKCKPGSKMNPKKRCIIY